MRVTSVRLCVVRYELKFYVYKNVGVRIMGFELKCWIVSCAIRVESLRVYRCGIVSNGATIELSLHVCVRI